MPAAKTTRTFSLDREILSRVKRTKGSSSESKRVNDLLRLALDLEQRAALEQEIAGFFGSGSDDRDERRAFQSATLASWSRD